MKRSFQLLLSLLLITWCFSTAIFAQSSTAGHRDKTTFLNPEQECTGTGELIYDDGTFENGYGWNAALVTEGRSVMLFTPTEYPWHFTNACIAFTQNQTTSLDFDIVVYANDGTGGAPGTFVAEVTGLNASGIPGWPTLAWYEYDISSLPNLESGSWYIGIRWNNVPAYPGTYIGADETPNPPAQPGYGWSDYDGVWNDYSTWYPSYNALGFRTLGEPAGTSNVIFSDDFDSYTAGQQLACQNPDDWTTWSLDPCNATEDAYVSDAYAYSGANSFVVVQNNDEVHYWGPETSGKYEIDFYNYIPTGYTGYFNTLGQFIATQEWGLEVYFNAGGAGSINAGGTGAGSFTWVADTWVLNQVVVDLDNDQAEYWYDGNMLMQWQWTAGSNGTPIALSLAANDFFGAAATDQMYVDDYAVINAIPVEMTSFTANVVNGTVKLDWTTATETNNKGFEVQKKFGNDFHTIAFVEGNGTSTQQHSYSYVDNDVANGNYSYRLRQVDFDGSSEFSQVVEVTVNRPIEYNLAQNYPNPFNPSTKINYGLKVDSKVTLKVFDILGQEVATLLNGNIAAGNHSVTFDASKLNSGVYLYKIEASGVDGSSFTSVKKMILTK